MKPLAMPVVTKLPEKQSRPDGDYADFPLQFYRYSSLVRFSENPFMFKVNYINNEVIETTSSAASVLGSALHKAMQAYMGGAEEVSTPADEAGAIKVGYEYGHAYLQGYSEGMIEWSKTIDSMAKMMERYSFAYFEYVKALNLPKRAPEMILVEKKITQKIEVDGKVMPIPLSGTIDMAYRDAKKRVRLHDHKFTSRFSDPEEIDGAKLVQAAFYYFLGYAETGEAPYSITFAECKITENKDKSEPQVREFEIVYKDHPLLFELFFRLYQDVTDALMGKQVYVPNMHALFDREVSILAYIHRLDTNEKDEQFKKMKVDNITDFLKKKIQKAGTERKYLETVSKKFISAKTLNYAEMTIPERIKMKLAEHGIGVEYDSVVKGGSIELYRFEPSVGVKMSRVEAFAKDIEQVVGVSGIRVLAPIPDSELIGFEVPNKKRTFPEVVPEVEGWEIALGQDIYGETIHFDLRTAPHTLVAGATGSGKSVFISNLIWQLKTLPEAKLALLDPKMVELQRFADDTTQYADQPKEIRDVLRRLVKEMNARYKRLQAQKVNSLALYNQKAAKPDHYLFVIIDEYGDLSSHRAYGEEIQTLVLLLAQKARAAGIHIILTTQRPSTKIITGDIKANFPTRIAFKTATATDSQVILDESGAEKLLGKGDMLARLPEARGLVRLQGFNG